jgi:hypothetical protein
MAIRPARRFSEQESLASFITKKSHLTPITLIYARLHSEMETNLSITSIPLGESSESAFLNEGSPSVSFDEMLFGKPNPIS